MKNNLNMREIASIIKDFDAELRNALATGRSGIFKNASGELYLKQDVPLGQGYKDEVLGIFADTADLDFFYKIYL
ncbi:MAG: hypothetical protein K9N35_00650 [Candidatus Marinimicrobia bacterium]|nr:hypothetical protein [Candidatus Neomarinimicrobiota bacterium]